MNKIINLKNTTLLKEILVQYNSLLRAQVSLDTLTTAKKCLLESGQSLPNEVQELLMDDEDKPQEVESMNEKEKCEPATSNGVEPPAEVKEDTSLFNMEDDNGDSVAPPPSTTPPPEERIPLNEEVAPPTDRLLSQSLPEDIATHTPTNDTIGHSLPQLPGHAHQLPNPAHQLPDSIQQPVVKSPPTTSLPVSSVSPSDALPLITRMGSIKTSNDDEPVVVRKKRGSSGKKKRRGSADSGTINRSSSMISQLSLDDIMEGQISTIISPTHSQLSSASSPSFSSPVHLDSETEKFTESVNGAMHSLSSPVVLCSADNMRKLLLKWVGQLHNYHAHLESIGVTFKEALSSAHFLSPIKDSVSELLVVCLEMEIFPSKGSRDDLSKESSEDAKGSGTQREIPVAEGSGVDSGTLDNNASSIDTGSEIKPKGSDGANCVSKGPGDDGLFVDFIATYYSHALSYDVIKVHINKAQLAKTTSVWRELAAGEQEEVDQTSADINESDTPPLITPRALSNLYTKDPNAFLSVGVASFPSIKLWEVIALCQLDYFEDKMGVNADLTTYCKYLDAIFSKHSPSSLDLMNYFNDPQLIIVSVAAVLLALPTQEVKDQQGNPIEGSHLASWPHETSLTGLTRVTCTSTEVGVVENVASMFEREGYWKGYVQICVSKKKKEQLIKVAAYLRSSSLLHELTSNGEEVTIFLISSFFSPSSGYPFKSTSVWKSFTGQLVELVIPVHPVSPDGLNWDVVLREMVCMIGVEETGKVLETLDGVSWSLPHQLHELFVRLASVHKEQRTIAHNLLEKVDRYLWSVRPTTLGPHVSIVLQKDEAKSTEEETNDDTTKTEALRDIMSPPPLPYPLISPITMEDWASHWGIRTSTSRCGLCGHSLMNRISDKERGGIGFQCGHAFHKQCCPEQACTLCFLLKYKNHLTNNANKR
uniref:HPS5 TPR domain-containing protein n=1 Tax=Amphimedon queenslandica TaxID=400682 RepID=A0A1X7VC51_AMPQE